MIAVVGVAAGLSACSVGGHPRLARLDDPAAVQARFAIAAETQARTSLAAGRPLDAAAAAEIWVAAAPARGDARRVLGQAYLAGGRFVSAAQAFGDALRLQPGDGGALLGRALALSALGQGSAARGMLAGATAVPAADRGLALALAGDPAGAVAVLQDAARAPGADGRVRQNLALAQALAGDWAGAKASAAHDLAGDQLVARLQSWAALPGADRPASRAMAVLGIAARPDPGMPVQIALAEPVADPRPAEVAKLVALAPLRPVRLVTLALRPPAEPVRASDGAGEYAVQIGAYGSLKRAGAGWQVAAARFAALGGRQPHADTRSRNGLVRLTVAGFATRGQAQALCAELRSNGGDCFIRRRRGGVPLVLAQAGTAPAG